MYNFERVDDFFLKALEKKVFTGASVLAAENSEIMFYKSYGYNCDKKEEKTTLKTVFDLASLTKPLATAICFQLLWQEGKISPDNYVSKFVQGFDKNGKNFIKLENLLLHNSGLPAHKHYYEKLCFLPFDERENARIGWISREALISLPGTKTLYSDLGFMVLKNILEKVSGMNISQYIKNNFYDKVGSELFYGSKIKKNLKDFCSTGFSSFRKRHLKGEVNDDNAFSIGGEDGHSGLFGTCIDIHCVLNELVGSFLGAGNKVLKNDFTEKMLKIRKNRRALGFDGKSYSNSSCGDSFSLNTVGHLGFTGTSFWVDLEFNRWIILLTNRVFCGDNNEKIKEFRPKLHNLISNLV
ncbi:MAG: serine hydrolase [Desulforegulaceae bacterium]|nr:serine hydrolase [Desulforegulaceae bacterium]